MVGKMVGEKEILGDEIRHQIGNSLVILDGWYRRYCNHPEMVEKCMWIMLKEAIRLVEKLKKIYEDEHI